MRDVYRYVFEPDVSLDEVEASILVAIFAAEGVHGTARVRLHAGYHLDQEKRVCVIDARTDVGETVAQVFTGFLVREFGEDAFRVDRVHGDARGAPAASAVPAGARA